MRNTHLKLKKMKIKNFFQKIILISTLILIMLPTLSNQRVTEIIVDENIDMIENYVLEQDEQLYESYPASSTNSEGDQLWNITWGGSGGDYGQNVLVGSSGNVYVSGHTDSYGKGGNDTILVKYDSSGIQLWNVTWGGVDNDYGIDVVVNSSGNVYVTGYTQSFGAGNSDMLLVKYDSSGTQLWNTTWGGVDYDYGNDVMVDFSGNIYITGQTNNSGAGLWDIILVKYNSSGIQLWNTTWGGVADDSGYGVEVDSLDNVYVTGQTNNFGAGSSDLCLVKLEAERNSIKKIILSLGAQYPRLQFSEIIEECGGANKKLITGIIKEMIENQEINAKYYEKSKSVVFNQQSNIAEKLDAAFDDWEEHGKDKSRKA